MNLTLYIILARSGIPVLSGVKLRVTLATELLTIAILGTTLVAAQLLPTGTKIFLDILVLDN